MEKTRMKRSEIDYFKIINNETNETQDESVKELEFALFCYNDINDSVVTISSTYLDDLNKYYLDTKLYEEYQNCTVYDGAGDLIAKNLL